MPKLLYVVVLLSLISFILCLAAEFKKSKKKDVKWDAEWFCYVAETEAFGLGIAAAICMAFAQIAGTIAIYPNCPLVNKKEKFNRRIDSRLSEVFLFVSWVSFAVALVLLSTATSMSQTQSYGDGWLNEECYLVKPGVFATSGCLAVLTLTALLVAAASKTQKKDVEMVGNEDKDKEKRENKSDDVVLVAEEEQKLENLHQSKLKKDHDGDGDGVGRI